MYIFKWIWTNGTILTMFLLGIKYNMNGFLTFSVGIYWVLSILSLTLFNNTVIDKMIKELYSNGEPFIPLWINTSYDSAITIMLAYFNYPVLALFYIIHILGQSHYHHRREKFINNDIEDK